MKATRCRRCKRKLTNKASRRAGIGPFCAVMEEKERFGTVQEWVDELAGVQKKSAPVTANILKELAHAESREAGK